MRMKSSEAPYMCGGERLDLQVCLGLLDAGACLRGCSGGSPSQWRREHVWLLAFPGRGSVHPLRRARWEGKEHDSSQALLEAVPQLHMPAPYPRAPWGWCQVGLFVTPSPSAQAGFVEDVAQTDSPAALPGCGQEPWQMIQSICLHVSAVFNLSHFLHRLLS